MEIAILIKSLRKYEWPIYFFKPNNSRYISKYIILLLVDLNYYLFFIIVLGLGPYKIHHCYRKKTL